MTDVVIHSQAYYLHNFLEPYEGFINSLITRLTDFVNNSLTNEIAIHILEIIQKSSQADFVFILGDRGEDNWVIKSKINLAEDTEQDAYLENLKSIIFPIIYDKSVFNPGHHGSYKTYETKNGIVKALVVIPMKSPQKA
ncbi:MAG: hypothetical protein ICV78_17450 [Tolypothrix sp. Co-bin9]|nr:hypothetical protein [Tolypothrix sp. Co-bin9]